MNVAGVEIPDAAIPRLRGRLSPSRWAEDVGWKLDPWQAGVLDSRALRALWNVTRQGGKSSCAALLAVHTAVHEDGSLVLLLSPSLRQSGELFRKCVAINRQAGRPVPADAETRLTMDLANGSRIVSLPGNDDTVRGFSGVRLAVVDEAARVPDSFFYAISPVLAVSGGRLVTLSTTAGQRGWWHAAWQASLSGAEDWERTEIPWRDCPRIPPSFIEQERRAMPPSVFAAEYECRFTEIENSVFGYELVRGLMSADVEPLFGAGAAAGAAGPLARTLSDDVRPLAAGAA